MFLCIDQGNSRIKAAVFDAQGCIVDTFLYKTFTPQDIEVICNKYTIEASIISSVVNIEQSILSMLNNKSKHFILFDHLTPLPIKNLYSTPETLGHDRIAAAVGAVTLYPDSNLLIIDAGSAITYDYVDKKGNYYGGNIAPGIKMRLASLHSMTHKLPLLTNVDVDENILFGRDTVSAIKLGVIQGVAFEVDGYMQALKNKIGEYSVCLTGGNAMYITRYLDNAAIHYEKYLTLMGLYEILMYNLHGRK